MDENDKSIRYVYVENGDVSLHVAVAGTGKPVILLHGFPESRRSWQHQVAPLVEAGFSVWMPDLRGYGLSSIPPGRATYSLEHLADDIAAIARHTGHPRIHLVGHDWGGLIAWTFAAMHPDLLDRLVIMNAPHMGIYREKLWQTKQWRRSLYIAFFLLPWLPERFLAKNDFDAIRRIFSRLPLRKEAFSADDIATHVNAISRPGALHAALNYYRANLGTRAMGIAASARADGPVLVIWGERDSALDISLLDGLERFAPHCEIHRISNASHWVQNEAPDEVNEALLAFLKRPQK